MSLDLPVGLGVVLAHLNSAWTLPVPKWVRQIGWPPYVQKIDAFAIRELASLSLPLLTTVSRHVGRPPSVPLPSFLPSLGIANIPLPLAPGRDPRKRSRAKFVTFTIEMDHVSLFQ